MTSMCSLADLKWLLAIFVPSGSAFFPLQMHRGKVQTMREQMHFRTKLNVFMEWQQISRGSLALCKTAQCEPRRA